MIKKCPRCNKEFECKHSADCWCSKYTLTYKLIECLKNNYNDCLCEDCLRSLISDSYEK